MRLINMSYFKNKSTGNHRLFSMMKAFMVFLLLMTTSVVFYGQDKVIAVVRGIVKNDADDILAGATVSIQGTKTFTTTKKDGTFELKNVPEEAVLVISYVGHLRT